MSTDIDQIINTINKLQEMSNYETSELEKLYDIISKLSNKCSTEMLMRSINQDNKLELNLDDLNEDQLSIVKSTEKRIKVIAGPGSGKTRVTISRYLYLINECNYDPNSIILITFTKKAGEEILNRIKDKTNQMPFFVGTIHGFANRFLNTHKTVCDEDESKEMLNDICNQYRDENNEKYIDKIYIYYDYYNSDNSYSYKHLQSKFSIPTTILELIKTIFSDYKNIKKKMNIIDYNDLLVELLKVVKKGGPLVDSIKYICFDEFQDINAIQYQILESFNCNKMVVGDDNQSIYSFRGSDIKYIFDFNADYTYYLTKNYRSTDEIVKLYMSSIKYNTQQFDKKIKSMCENGIKPIVSGFKNSDSENKYIIGTIKKLQKEGVKLSDIVILSRNNKTLNKLELELNKSKIPSINYNNTSLLNKVHIKNFISFVNVIINDNNDLHWKRILRMLNYNTENVTNYKKKLIEKNSDIYNKIVIIRSYSVKEQLKEIYKFFNKTLKASDIILNDIKTIISFFQNYTSLVSVLNDINLTSNIEEDYSDKIYLSTIHGSKGLEWKYVFCVNISSLFGLKWNDYDKIINNLEEERRLFYVAMSRAEKYLSITFSGKPPQFIQELNKKKYNGTVKIDHDYNPNSVLSVIEKFGIHNKICEQLISLGYSTKKVTDILNISNQYSYRLFFKLLVGLMFYSKYPDSKFSLSNYISIDTTESNKSDIEDKYVEWRDKINIVNDITTNDNELINNNSLFDEIYTFIDKFIKPKSIKFNKYIILDDSLFDVKCNDNYTFNILDIVEYILFCKKNKLYTINVYNVIKGCVYTINLTDEIINEIDDYFNG